MFHQGPNTEIYGLIKSILFHNYHQNLSLIHFLETVYLCLILYLKFCVLNSKNVIKEMNKFCKFSVMKQKTTLKFYEADRFLYFYNKKMNIITNFNYPI